MNILYKNINRIIKVAGLIILISVSISGCITNSSVSRHMEELIKSNEQSFVKRSIFGVYIIENDNKEIEVYRVNNKSVADKNDIRIGDIIISVDNIEIKNRSQLFNLIYERKNPGDTIDIILKRREGFIRKTITPPTNYIIRDLYALLYEITKNEEPVNLAIVINSIGNVYLQDGALEQWIVATKSLVISQCENYYLSFLRPERNFMLVEREKISKVLKEFEMQYSGFVDESSQHEIGYMLGASHLLLIDYHRTYISNNKALDVETHNLIEVKTGKKLASVSLMIPISSE